jgi:hypothetical protein
MGIYGHIKFKLNLTRIAEKRNGIIRKDNAIGNSQQ